MHLFTETVVAVSLADVHPRVTWDEPSRPLTVRVLGSAVDNKVLTLQSHRSGAVGRRWSWICPVCHRRARFLYARDSVSFACRACSRLRYISENWTSASRLMNHFASERERLEQQHRRGPKLQRYWATVAREQRAVRTFLEQLDRARRRA